MGNTNTKTKQKGLVLSHWRVEWNSSQGQHRDFRFKYMAEDFADMLEQIGFCVYVHPMYKEAE